MYQAGQQVVYGIHGVCTIREIETKIVDRKKIPYYVLEPAAQLGARFYVPTEKPEAVGKISPVMSKDEIQSLFSHCPIPEGIWVEEENQRKQKFRDLIGNGDRSVLVAIVKSLYNHKAVQAEKGKKFHLCDENFLRDGERLLSSEVSVAYGIPIEEALRFVRSCLQK